MRKMLVVLALMSAISAQAEQIKFGDINYFLKDGQFTLGADVNSTYAKSKTYNNGEVLETRGVLFQTRFGYGITERFNAFLGLDYAYDRQVEQKAATPPRNAFSQDGLANPAVGLNYRLFNQKELFANLDFGIVGRINIEDAEVGISEVGSGNQKDGNFANGRSSVEFNVRLGQKWNEANEWQIAAGVVSHLSGETTYRRNFPNNDLVVEEYSSEDYFLRASYQYRPVNEFMILLTAQATQVGGVNGIDNDIMEMAWERKSHVDLLFGFTAKYLITSNFIANFNYHLYRNADYDIVVAGVNDELKERRQNFFGLGVDFLF
jgi:hypothetical protein